MQPKTKNRKIAYIVGDLGNGGQERQLLYLLQQLTTVTKDITVIVWQYNADDYHVKNYKDLGINLLAIDKENTLLNRVAQLRQIVKKEQPVIVHSYTFYLNFFTWLACLGCRTIPIGGIRSRLTLHLHETGRLLGYLSMIFPKNKISNNEFYASGFANNLVKKRLHQTYIITNHLDLDKFQYAVPPVGTVRTASIGRFTEEKRIEIIVEIITGLRNKGIDVVHHHAGNGPLMDSVREKIQAEGLVDRFILQGEVTDINSFLSDKHFFIHAAHTEGYPNVIMEAMACGKPVVTTDCGDVRNMVIHGENGFIHELNDTSGMIASCEKLANNYQLLSAFAKKSRQLAEQKFSLDHLLEQTLKTYDKICAE